MTPREDVERLSHAELADSRRPRGPRARGRLGVQQGDRVGTFAWNNQRHFELYMAIPCTGAVLHTLNVRLFSEQLVYIINHAEDRVIFLDDVARAADGRTRARARVRGALRGDRRRRGARPAGRAALRGAAGRGGARAVRVPRARRAPGRGAVLHERHHRQPEGRAVLAPLDQPALDGHADARRHRAGARRPGAGGGADVPRQRLGPALRGRAGGLGPDPARPLPRRRVAGRPDQLRASRP